MKTLEEAWGWYEAVRQSLNLVDRLGRRYWTDLDWGGRLGRDDRLRSLDGPDLVRLAGEASEPLDDLAVLVLFSVFEAEVRDLIGGEVEIEREGLRHPAILAVIDEMLDRIREGSFFGILRLYKAADEDAVERVNQVRRYRNWVAHGKKGVPPDRVDPRSAYDRLSAFLSLIRPSPGTGSGR